MDEKHIVHKLSNMLSKIEILERRVHLAESRYANGDVMEVIVKTTYDEKQDMVLYLDSKIIRDHLQENLKNKISEYNDLKTQLINPKQDEQTTSN